MDDDDSHEDELQKLSPRPPPSGPPPPVPQSQPPMKSNNIFGNMEELNIPPIRTRNGRRAKRRASLPTINILPSFQSLKNVMGFGVDEDDKSPLPNDDNNNKNGISNNNGSDNNNNSKQLLFMKNLNLRKESDKLKMKLKASKERILELNNQVDLKNEVLRKLHSQISENEKRNEIQKQMHRKFQELQRLLVAKDTTIQKMKQEMNAIQKKHSAFYNNAMSNNNNNNNDNNNINEPQKPHSRSLTPGGYDVDIPWDVDTPTNANNDNNRDFPSAPSFDALMDKANDDDGGLSLNSKLRQRPSWLELKARGILLGDPNVSASLSEAQRGLHRRKASLKVDKLLKDRPSWQQLNNRGILKDNPNKSHSLQAAQRELHKRKASANLDKFLYARPKPDYLYTHNIIDSPNDIFGDIDSIEQNMDSLLQASQPSQNERKKKLCDKLKQRPSIDETMSRGILLDRPDTGMNYDLLSRHRQLQKRRASQQLEKMLNFRPQKKVLEQKKIFLTNESYNAQKEHTRKASADLQFGLSSRKSLSDLKGMGLFSYDFTGLNNLNFTPVDDDDDDGGGGGGGGDDDDYYYNTNDDGDMMVNTATIFRHKPQTSKPLQELDFAGFEFDDKRRDSFSYGDDAINVFEPSLLNFQDKILRLSLKLGQRPSVNDMQMRGLLYEHPSMSAQLIARKQNLMRRRASSKVASLMSARPKRYELESKNILLSEGDTLEKRGRHKRKRSQDLENNLQRRPKAMPKEEYEKKRRESILNNELLSETTLINIGGMVVPFVSPFMSSFGQRLLGAGDSGHVKNKKSHVITDYRETIDDLKDQIQEKEAIISQLKQNDYLQTLKVENGELKQKIARLSLLDSADMDAFHEQSELDRIGRELDEYRKHFGSLPIAKSQDPPTAQDATTTKSADAEDTTTVAAVIEDTTTKEQLREEVSRVNRVVQQNMADISRLEKENEIFRFQLDSHLREKTANLGGRLKKHSMLETQIMDQSLQELKHESDFQKMNELQKENDFQSNQIAQLQDRIRRQSTASSVMNAGDGIGRFYEWSARLSWSDDISEIFNEKTDECSENDYFLIMKRVMSEQRSEHKMELDNQRQSDFIQISNFVDNNKKPKHRHRVSAMNADDMKQGSFTSSDASTAQELLSNPLLAKVAHLQKQLERQRRDHLKDKERFAINAAGELNRLRDEIRSIGSEQEKLQRIEEEQQRMKQQSYYNYLSSFIWTK